MKTKQQLGRPFVWCGNKTLVAKDIWDRFGDVAHYYEPFAGALGCLLSRPAETTSKRRYEYVGDNDCQISNFWRAAKFGTPQVLANWADWTPSSFDLIARMKWLKEQKERLRRHLIADPMWYDAQVAGWFAWTESVRIAKQGKTLRLSNGAGTGVARRGENLVGLFQSYKDRLQNVTVYYGDWSHLANAALRVNNAAIMLDPPYGERNSTQKIYDHHSLKVADQCRRFALAAASPKLKIALCGYAGEYAMPNDWEELPWFSQWGRGRERIWFSPHCLKS